MLQSSIPVISIVKVIVMVVAVVFVVVYVAGDGQTAGGFNLYASSSCGRNFSILFPYKMALAVQGRPGSYVTPGRLGTFYLVPES